MMSKTCRCFFWMFDWAVLSLLAVVLLGTAVVAHEQKTALTDIFYNERSGNLEVAHRISLHDAEHVVRRVEGIAEDIVESEKAREAFARHLSKQFDLQFANGETVELILLGQEIDEGFLWVYQEAPLPKPLERSFSIRNVIMQEEVEGQLNTVNVRFQSHVWTFSFLSGDGRRKFGGTSMARGKG